MRFASVVLAAATLAASLTAPPAVAADVIKIGAPLALTGGLADEGKKQAVGFDMWLKRINAAGGIKVGDKMMKVELVTYDYQTDGARAQQLAEKLITDDKVVAMLSPYGSGHTKIVAGVTERYGIPLLASAASSEAVYDPNYKYLFGTLAPNSGLVDVMIDLFLKDVPGIKKVAILGRDDIFPKAMADSMKDKTPKAGLEVVYAEYYAVGTMDMSAPISKIKAASPDWIFVSGYTQDTVLARKAMQDLGVTAKLVTMITGPAYREYTEALGPLANGVTSAVWWHPATTFTGDDPWGSTQAFTEEYRAREHAEPDYVHASSAACLVAIQKAIEKAGSIDPAKIRDALASLDIMTFYGPLKFGPNGMNIGRDLPIIQVQDQKEVVLYPEAIKQGKTIAFK